MTRPAVEVAPAAVGLPEWTAMQFWKPHVAGQAARRSARPAHRRQGPQAIVDLPGVAEGTEGKVILANGFNWQRYRVRFADGTELGDLDQRNIVPIGRRPLAEWPSPRPGPADAVHFSPRPGSGAAW